MRQRRLRSLGNGKEGLMRGRRGGRRGAFGKARVNRSRRGSRIRRYGVSRGGIRM